MCMWNWSRSLLLKRLSCSCSYAPPPPEVTTNILQRTYPSSSWSRPPPPENDTLQMKHPLQKCTFDAIHPSYLQTYHPWRAFTPSSGSSTNKHNNWQAIEYHNHSWVCNDHKAGALPKITDDKCAKCPWSVDIPTDLHPVSFTIMDYLIKQKLITTYLTERTSIHYKTDNDNIRNTNLTSKLVLPVDSDGHIDSVCLIKYIVCAPMHGKYTVHKAMTIYSIVWKAYTQQYYYSFTIL